MTTYEKLIGEFQTYLGQKERKWGGPLAESTLETYVNAVRSCCRSADIDISLDLDPKQSSSLLLSLASRSFNRISPSTRVIREIALTTFVEFLQK